MTDPTCTSTAKSTDPPKSVPEVSFPTSYFRYNLPVYNVLHICLSTSNQPETYELVTIVERKYIFKMQAAAQGFVAYQRKNISTAILLLFNKYCSYQSFSVIFFTS